MHFNCNCLIFFQLPSLAIHNLVILNLNSRHLACIVYACDVLFAHPHTDNFVTFLLKSTYLRRVPLCSIYLLVIAKCVAVRLETLITNSVLQN